ncbi:hypothetical protein [Algoriphagus yeomjeoni]|uniref:Uncharacterized protein n=1 Tax=Algoriphagus yeomjeoni TaxID=291403 RepID=A0A327PFF9_9BACT|nr:hypothetical protein [Algoriphagus yeomjeoni]RAI90187.1 hypothetical protein LV83_02198 [Algoriphagus yeomjeoni]
MKKPVLFCSIALLFTFCTNRTSEEIIASEAPTQDELLQQGQVNVQTQGMDFLVADTLYSGWNELIYDNQSSEVHFILMDFYPEGKTVEDTKKEVLPPFDEGMKKIIDGQMDEAVAAFGKLPEWFFSVQYHGGTGLISPGQTAKSTIFLSPGLYVMECYVKAANGEWHTSHGMIKQIIVRDSSTTKAAPSPNASITISSTEGVQMANPPGLGSQVMEVNFQDQKVYEHFVGHDVNLVRYEDDASLDSLQYWLSWMNPTGLRTPAPEGFTFLGGMNNLGEGGKGYFEAELIPGNYVLISEVPEAEKKGLIAKFQLN